MSINRPKIKAPTPAAPEPAEGAEELRLGSARASSLRSTGSVGRLRLRTDRNA